MRFAQAAARKPTDPMEPYCGSKRDLALQIAQGDVDASRQLDATARLVVPHGRNWLHGEAA